MYQPTSRLLTVLELLQARPVISGSELARRLEVDGRTVRRYIVTLQDLGIPVEATHGRYGGYRLRPGFKLPPLLFTEEEALAVALGLIAARRSGLAATAPATEGALAKMERVLPEAVRTRIQALEETIAFTETPVQPQPASGDALLTLSTAAHHRRRVWIRYRDAAGAKSEREFDAYGLVYHAGRWYVVGHDHRSGEIRTFRVDRVAAVEEREATFERPPDFDAARQLEYALATLPWGEEIEVVIYAPVEQLRAWVPAHFATLEETDGGVVLRSQADDLAMAARYLIWLGHPFVVRSPAALNDELRRIAAELEVIANREPGEPAAV